MAMINCSWPHLEWFRTSSLFWTVVIITVQSNHRQLLTVTPTNSRRESNEQNTLQLSKSRKVGLKGSKTSDNKWSQMWLVFCQHSWKNKNNNVTSTAVKVKRPEVIESRTKEARATVNWEKYKWHQIDYPLVSLAQTPSTNQIVNVIVTSTNKKMNKYVDKYLSWKPFVLFEE